MSYSGCQRICALLPNLMNGASTLTDLGTSVTPASPAYVAWLSSGCALIEGKLRSLGYGVPVPSTLAVYDFIADLEAQYGAYRGEQSRGSTRSGTGQRTRADGFLAAFNDGMKMLEQMDLARAGLEHTSVMYTAGISVSDKEIDQGDSDAVQPRFTRGAFDGEFSATAAS